MPNTDLDEEATRHLAEVIARNDAVRNAAGISVTEAIRLNIEHARELLRKRRKGQ